MREDARPLRPLFAKVVSVSQGIPECDVLIAYVRLDQDGAVKNTTDSLERIVAGSKATIVILAAENAVDHYIRGTSWFNSLTAKYGGSINLVMTLSRKGALFPQFFAKLFAQMKAGETMPVAWNNLAPQIPGMEHEAPDTIFACGAGHIAFAKRPSFWTRLFSRK